MTKIEKIEAKRMAKRVAETAGEMKNVVMTKMTLLETGSDGNGNFDYVMFEYEGKQYQAYEDAILGGRKFDEYKPYEEETKMVELLAFTGMSLGHFPVMAETADTMMVLTKNGTMVIDKATKLQKDPKNPKFANRIA